MEIKISSEISIKHPSTEVISYCREKLVFSNPDYEKRLRQGLWVGKTSKTMSLYRVDGETVIVPCGVGKHLKAMVRPDDCLTTDLADNGVLNYKGQVSLFDYQEPAVEALTAYGCGILQSPCGSGKTQMGIALAARLKRKTLWITHTKDLLQQSYDRAKQYFPESSLGTITGGQVKIGSHITFATVQTLCKLDLARYRYSWDVVIVDECHRVAGTPTQVTMFYRVVSSLAARYKYGLSATVNRSDGLINTTFAILGDVAYRVPDEAVKEKTVQVTVIKRDTDIPVSRFCLDTDGTMIYGKLLPYLTAHQERNSKIVEDLKEHRDGFNLVLSDRLEHLRELMRMLPKECQDAAVMIDGGMTSKTARMLRTHAIGDMRAGRKHYLFATFSLAKEGLDIPRLNGLYLTTPRKDYAVITQSIGRIARVFEGKEDAVCYDYVDDIEFCRNQFKRRKTTYRKAGCRIVE